MLVYYLAIVAVLVLRSRCYLIHSDKFVMQSAEGLAETENAILVEDHVVTVLNGGEESEVENLQIGGKGKIGGGKRRTHAEIAKELPDVSNLLYHDAPVNLKPIIPVVGMQLGRSTAGVAYTEWLTLLALDGYSYRTVENTLIVSTGQKAIKSTPGRCNQNMHRWNCKSPTCGWYVLIRLDSLNGWYVDALDLTHNKCASIIKTSSKTLKRKLMSKVHYSTTTAKDIRTAASEENLGDIDSKQSQRVLKSIKNDKRGHWSEGFTYLPSFIGNLCDCTHHIIR